MAYHTRLVYNPGIKAQSIILNEIILAGANILYSSGRTKIKMIEAADDKRRLNKITSICYTNYKI